jgi:hypothetical protein
MLTNAMATATTWAMALAMTLQVTKWAMAWVTGGGVGKDAMGDKWAMARATRVIVTNAAAAILASAVMSAIFIAAAAITIAQCHHPQHSHCSGCCHHPPL